MTDTISPPTDTAAIRQVTLRSGGMTAKLLNIGAALQDLRLDGWPHALVLGYSDLSEYFKNPDWFGPIVGRFANRIAGARANIDAVDYKFDQNAAGGHTLHGGRAGSAHRIWQIDKITADSVEFSDILPNGHMGFPGTLTVRVCYQLISAALDIRISATTDAPTLCNFAHHSYFTLNNAGDLAAHTFEVRAEKYLPVDVTGIPNDIPTAVVDSVFDYRTAKRLVQSKATARLDHNYCLSDRRRAFQDVAWLRCPETGLELRVATNEPGLQVYAAGHLLGSGPRGHHGQSYTVASGLALEPQSWPDSPNQPGYPSALLRPGESYLQHSRFSFSRVKT